jgi:hypothetical protein
MKLAIPWNPNRQLGITVSNTEADTLHKNFKFSFYDKFGDFRISVFQYSVFFGLVWVRERF